MRFVYKTVQKYCYIQFQFNHNKDATTECGIMQRYGSSWSYLRAERMLRLPTHSRDSHLNRDSRAQEYPPICWTRAVV